MKATILGAIMLLFNWYIPLSAQIFHNFNTYKYHRVNAEGFVDAKDLLPEDFKDPNNTEPLYLVENIISLKNGEGYIRISDKKPGTAVGKSMYFDNVVSEIIEDTENNITLLKIRRDARYHSTHFSYTNTEGKGQRFSIETVYHTNLTLRKDDQIYAVGDSVVIEKDADLDATFQFVLPGRYLAISIATTSDAFKDYTRNQWLDQTSISIRQLLDRFKKSEQSPSKTLYIEFVTFDPDGGFLEYAPYVQGYRNSAFMERFNRYIDGILEVRPYSFHYLKLIDKRDSQIPTAIEEVEENPYDPIVAVYDLLGHRLPYLPQGACIIRRRSGKSEKLILPRSFSLEEFSALEQSHH